jgi:hypothetical protein
MYMSICVHKEFRGTKNCPLCYPKYPNYGGVVEEVFSINKNTPQKPLCKSSTTVHHARKNVSNYIIKLKLFMWHYDAIKTVWKKKFKGVRFY